MSIALGLMALALYVAAVIGLAAGVTWVVVRLLPRRRTGKPAQRSVVAHRLGRLR